MKNASYTETMTAGAPPSSSSRQDNNSEFLTDLPLRSDQDLPDGHMLQYPTYQQVLLGSMFYHARDAVLSMTLGTIYTPFDRVASLLTIEGELRRQKVLPSEGFGGIRSCWLQLWDREGIMGCMRSGMWTPLLRFPTRLLGDVFSTVFCHHCYRRYHIEPFVVMATAMVASVCVTAPYNAWQRVLRTIFRADLKTVENTDEKALPRTQGRMEAFKGWCRKVWRGRSNVKYHFSSLRACVDQVAGHLTQWKLVTSTVLLEIVYKNAFMWLLPILITTIPAGNTILGRGATLLVRDVLIQPFRVIMGRMAVSAAFSRPQEKKKTTATNETAGTVDTEIHPRMYTGVWDCICTVFEEEGAKGMWAGLRYRLLLSSMAWVSMILAPPAVEGADY